MRHVFIFVNGILNLPGDSRGWTDRAVQYVHNHCDGAAADKFEYFSPALLRRLFQRGHAMDLAETMAEYPGARLHLVGHSNGCDLICRALRLTSVEVASVHLISGAVERDFEKNGLAEKLRRGQVRHVFCLCSRGDHVLRYVARASQVATLGLLGYGDLGCRGPAKPTPPRVWLIWRDRMGHSDWFHPANFRQTLETVTTEAFTSE